MNKPLRPPTKVRHPRTKLVALDLQLAQKLYRENGEPRLTIDGAFQHVQDIIFKYEADLALGLVKPPNDGTLTVHINNQPIARFVLR